MRLRDCCDCSDQVKYLRAWLRVIRRDLHWVETGSLEAFRTTALKDIAAALRGTKPRKQ